jgi:hypothetical protein
VLDPADLLTVARLLAAPGVVPVATQAQLRRAVSTAYYALFHTVLAAGSARFVGADKAGNPGYSIIYRSFAHGRMRSVCEAIDVSVLSRTLERNLRRTSVSLEARGFAGRFVVLQDARHLADYDPTETFIQTDVDELLDSAEIAIIAFAGIQRDEQSDILALMLSNPRQ